jgi:hypothetical protein
VTDVVERPLAALNEGDLPEFVACYSDHATIEDGYGKG